MNFAIRPGGIDQERSAQTTGRYQNVAGSHGQDGYTVVAPAGGPLFRQRTVCSCSMSGVEGEHPYGEFQKRTASDRLLTNRDCTAASGQFEEPTGSRQLGGFTLREYTSSLGLPLSRSLLCSPTRFCSSLVTDPVLRVLPDRLSRPIRSEI